MHTVPQKYRVQYTCMACGSVTERHDVTAYGPGEAISEAPRAKIHMNCPHASLRDGVMLPMAIEHMGAA